MGTKLSIVEILAAFESPEVQKRFPPILNIAQVAQLLQLSRSTIYQWSCKGKLDFAKSVRGKRPRFWRDKVILWYFDENDPA